MSHKAAKAIRKAIHATGNNVREVILMRKPFFMPVMPPAIGPGCMVYPRDLSPVCGRAIYRQHKKELRAA